VKKIKSRQNLPIVIIRTRLLLEKITGIKDKLEVIVY